jgi:hypothetical protein
MLLTCAAVLVLVAIATAQSRTFFLSVLPYVVIFCGVGTSSCTSYGANVVFVIEAADGVSSSTFQQSKQFAADVVSRIAVGAFLNRCIHDCICSFLFSNFLSARELYVGLRTNASFLYRVALITYGPTPTVVFNFEASYDGATIQANILSAGRIEGAANSTLALEQALALISAAPIRSTQDSAVVVLLSATPPPDESGFFFVGTQLKSVVPFTAAVGLPAVSGSAVSERQLALVADLVYLSLNSTTLAELSNGIGSLSGITCTGNPICASGNAAQTRPTDLVFVLDSSGSLQDVNWKKMLTFVSSVVAQLDVGENNTRLDSIFHTRAVGDLTCVLVAGLLWLSFRPPSKFGSTFLGPMTRTPSSRTF